MPPLVAVTGSQVSMPLHALPSSHAAAFAHENLQMSFSQPVFGPLSAPKSQSSPGSTMPLPHTAVGAMHAPSLHTRFAPQLLPFCVASGTAWHTCADVHWK